MNQALPYTPTPARGADIDKQGDTWALVLVRDLRHAPDVVWDALTDPEQLREWAPFDADRNLGAVGDATLSTVGAPSPQVDHMRVTRADRPHALEYTWGGNPLRWELEPQGDGTRLRLWHAIDRNFIAMGAAGWHMCFDVLGELLDGHPVGRRVGMQLMQDAGWQGLHKAYAQQFAATAPQD